MANDTSEALSARPGGVDRLVFDDALLEARDYWRRKLRSKARPARFLRESPCEPETGRQVECLRSTLPDDVVARLDRVTSREPFLRYAVLLAAVHICLYRYTRNPVVITGSPAAVGEDSPVPSNLVAIAHDVPRGVSFRSFCSSLRAALTEAYAHQQYPFRRVLADLGVPEIPPLSSLFEVVVALDGLHGEPASGAPISLRFTPREHGMESVLRFDARLSRAAAAAFVAQTQSLLEDALARPDSPVAKLRMASEEDLQRTVSIWKASRPGEPAPPVVTALERQAALAPDAIALVCDEQSITFDVLDRRANQLARFLQQRGVGAEVRVAICLDRSVDSLIAILGVLKAGGACVPLDIAGPPSRLARMIDRARVTAIVTDTAIAGCFQSEGAHVLALDRQWPVIMAQSEAPLDVDEHPESLAYVVHASASTSAPRGVEITRAGMANLVAAQTAALGLRRDDRVLQFASIELDTSVCEIFPALCRGAALEMVNSLQS
jgi:non-ribosomal peptide synthetase component F